jgi:hypothetical protein
MKPYFNDDFSKMLVERVAYSMTEASGKCNHTGAGSSCPLHGDADCNSSKQNRKEEIDNNLMPEELVGTTYEIEMEDGETIIIEKVKMDGKDDNGFKSCWKGYKKSGTKVKGGKEVNDCVKAGYEMSGDKDLSEVAPPGAKAERMVKHIKKSYAKDGKLTDKEKSIAYATAWKQKGKSVKEEAENKESEKDEGGKHKEYKHAKGKEEKGEKKTEKEMKEARNLPGNQEKIDANKNGKVDAHDFAILRNKRSKKTVKEMWQLAAEAKVQIDVMPEIDDKDPNNIKKKNKNEKEVNK